MQSKSSPSSFRTRRSRRRRALPLTPIRDVSRSYNLVASIPPRVDRGPIVSEVHRFVLSIPQTATASISNTIPILGAISMQANQFDLFSDLALAFDQYRIKEVEVYVFPTPQTAALTSNLQTVSFLSVVDLDDATAAGSLAELSDYNSCLETTAVDGHYHRFRPHVALAAYSGAFTSYGNDVDRWLDCNSNTVQHYGVKYGYAVAPAAVTAAYRVRAVFEFRTTH